MPMDPNVLGLALKEAASNIDTSLFQSGQAGVEAARNEMFKAFAQAIIDHIKNFALVTSSVPGVTAGGATVVATSTLIE